MEGIGIFWCIIEMLYEEGGFININEYERITYELRTNYEVVESVIEDFGLFIILDDEFHSNSVLDRLEQRMIKSRKAKESISKRWEKHKNTNVLQTKYDSNTIKERKGKENKGKENKEYIINDFDFEKFWNLYDKKIGDKNKIQKKWIALKQSERDCIFSTLPDYINSQPDKKYRKNPETYLNNKSWLDEIIKQTPGAKLNVETSNKGLGETNIETAAKVRQSLIEKYTSKDYEHPHS